MKYILHFTLLLLEYWNVFDTTRFCYQGKPKEATKLFVTAGKMDVQKILGFNFDLEEM